MSIKTKYQEKLDQVERLYNRFSKINQGILDNDDLAPDGYIDDVQNFFIQCFHLKDHLIHDSTVTIPDSVIEDFINHSPDMHLCADLANSVKHLVLTRRIRSGSQPEFKQRHFDLHVGTVPTSIGARFTIETSQGPIDAFDLATKCLDEWKQFINDNIE